MLVNFFLALVPLCSNRFIHPDFGLPPDIVAASLGNLGVEEVVGIEALVSNTARR